MLHSAVGSVFLAKTITSGKNVAVKQMDLSRPIQKDLLLNEITVMKETRHDNIVNFLDAYIVDETYLWVVMEYMEGGCLTDVIEKNNVKIGEGQISNICMQVSIAYEAIASDVNLLSFTGFHRLVADCYTCTNAASSIAI